jgi:hypothetical protein
VLGLHERGVRVRRGASGKRAEDEHRGARPQQVAAGLVRVLAACKFPSTASEPVT